MCVFNLCTWSQFDIYLHAWCIFHKVSKMYYIWFITSIVVIVFLNSSVYSSSNKRIIMLLFSVIICWLQQNTTMKKDRKQLRVISPNIKKTEILPRSLHLELWCNDSCFLQLDSEFQIWSRKLPHLKRFERFKTLNILTHFKTCWT